MPRPRVTHAMFGVRSGQIDPLELSRVLGLQPTHSFKKGDTYISKSSGLRYHSTSVWQWATTGQLQSDDINDHLILLLAKLEPKLHAIENLVSSKEHYVGIWLNWFAPDGLGGYSLPSNLLPRIARLCQELNIGFDRPL